MSIGFVLLTFQLFIFRFYLFPTQFGYIKVKGLACTCPDASVKIGQSYLKSITPDSLKEYELDYSEVYLTLRPTTNHDPMGVDLYLINAIVIGKERVSKGGLWNPLLKVKDWKQLDIISESAIKILAITEFLIIILLLRFRKSIFKLFT